MNSRRRHAPVLVTLAASLAASGLLSACSADPARGYSHASPYDDSIKTVAVNMFENRTFSPGLEVDLTDAVIKEIQRRTPWRVTSSDRADAVLSGAITSARLRALSTSPATGMVQEMGVELSIDFDLRHAASGRSIIARKDFKAMDTFVPTHASGQERLSVGELGAAQRLGSDLVAELRNTW